MRVRGKLLPEEIKEAGGFLRSKWYWPKLLLRNWYGLLLLVALLWGTVAKVVAGDREHWVGLLIVWSVVAAIFVWATFSTRRSQQKDFRVLNESLPDWLIFDDQGMQTQSENGRTSSRPWATLTGWREGSSVVCLTLSEAKSFMFVPLETLIAAERTQLCGIFRKHLGEKQNH